MADKEHQYTGTSDDVMANFISEEKLFLFSVGRLNFLYAYHPNVLVDETANATTVPGPMPNNRDTPPEINNVRVAYAHVHEGALHKTAKQISVSLVKKMHEFKDCPLAKRVEMSHPSKTSNRALKRRFRIFVDFEDKKHVKSLGGKEYPMIIRDATRVTHGCTSYFTSLTYQIHRQIYVRSQSRRDPF